MNDNVALPCVKCQYDLRGTATDASCPECGTPVLQSVLGYRVDGEYLVVTSGAKLPHRCALTNRDIDSTSRRIVDVTETLRPGGIMTPMTLRVSPRSSRVLACSFVMGIVRSNVLALTEATRGWEILLASIGVVMLAMGGVMFVVGMHMRRPPGWCRVYVSWRGCGIVLARKALLALLICLCVMPPLVLPMYVAFGYRAGLGVVAMTLCAVGTLVLPFYKNAVVVKRHADGEFWLAGCCQAYLRTCEAERRRVLDEAGMAAHDLPDDAVCEVSDGAAGR